MVALHYRSQSRIHSPLGFLQHRVRVGESEREEARKDADSFSEHLDKATSALCIGDFEVCDISLFCDACHANHNIVS